MKRLLTIILLMCLGNASAENATGTNLDCEDSHAMQNMISNICWTCVLPMRIMGVGPKPDGAAPNKVMCSCTDSNGIPSVGWQLGYFQPARVEEVVRTPWCSPFLGGIKLQDSSFEIGQHDSKPADGKSDLAFMDSHFFSYPVFQMLNLMLIPECAGDTYMDLDLLNMSEIDPLWSNDLLAFILNPESVVFANPLTMAWCAADCVLTTAGQESETNYFCAGCDGLLYPFTGNVGGASDPVRASSLLLQRQLATLHRKGLAQKTMGDDEMCGATYSMFIPRSQYKVSMLYPVPEAESTKSTTVTAPSPAGNTASPTSYSPGDDCCHRLGESVHKWSTLKGGRSRPGKENYVYLVWRYVDCCVLYEG